MPNATLTLTSANDDATETPAGVVSLTGTAARVDGSVASIYAAILRDSPIPPGSNVDVAYLDVWPFDTSYRSPQLTIRAELDPADLSTSANNLSGRSKTAAGAVWSATNITTGAYVASPSLAAVMQEVVEMPGYAQGDDVALFLIDNGTGGALRIRTYDGNSAQAPRLYLEWTEAAPGDALTYGWPHDYWPDEYWPEYWPDRGEGGPPPSSIIPLVMHHLKQQEIA